MTQCWRTIQTAGYMLTVTSMDFQSLSNLRLSYTDDMFTDDATHSHCGLDPSYQMLPRNTSECSHLIHSRFGDEASTARLNMVDSPRQELVYSRREGWPASISFPTPVRPAAANHVKYLSQVWSSHSRVCMSSTLYFQLYDQDTDELERRCALLLTGLTTSAT